MGDILAFFHCEGKTPDVRDRLKIFVSGGAMAFAVCLRILLLMLS